jgi:hypothetical protein
MPFYDSLDKIISVYFSSVTNQPFLYKGIRYKPVELFISPSLLRGFNCPNLCGGCCPAFTLDYINPCDFPYELTERMIRFNNLELPVYTDFQKNNAGHFCRNLNLYDGRCTIYKFRPFSCEFELIKFIRMENKVIITQKLYARGWAMKTVDGKKGAKCEMLIPTEETASLVIKKLEKLNCWAEYFKIETKITKIINWIKSINLDDYLTLSNPSKLV